VPFPLLTFTLLSGSPELAARDWKSMLSQWKMCAPGARLTWLTFPPPAPSTILTSGRFSCPLDTWVRSILLRILFLFAAKVVVWARGRRSINVSSSCVELARTSLGREIPRAKGHCVVAILTSGIFAGLQISGGRRVAFNRRAIRPDKNR
jgi:hypothetical protein